MSFNIFAGTRRVVLVIAAISVLCFVYWGFANSDATVYTTFTVDSPGATPTWTSWESSFGPGGRTEIKHLKTRSGTSVTLYLNFPEKKAADGRMLIPFRSEGGTWWMNTEFSDPVTTYTKQAADSFRFSAEQERLVDNQARHERWESILGAAGFLLGWLVFLGIGSWVMGWIVRGFFGIPSGMDFKPEKVKPEPIEEEA